MPDLSNSNDVGSALDSKVIYQRAESQIVNSIVNGIASLKLGFASVEDFSKFSGPSWSGSEQEQKWLSNYIYSNDPNIDKTKPIRLLNKKYKNSLFDNNPVVVIVIKYVQE